MLDIQDLAKLPLTVAKLRKEISLLWADPLLPYKAALAKLPSSGLNIPEAVVGPLAGCKVALVNGNKVKRIHDMDFIEGGHELAWLFMPPNTIWLDAHISLSELRFVLLHEVIERFLMAEFGKSYEESHEIANRYELLWRQKLAA